MMAAKNKSAPSGGGSRTLNYIILIVIAALVFYLLVLPAFTPKGASTTSTTTGGSSSTGTISLTPSTDIAGTMVTITGQMLPTNSSVTVTFDSTPLRQTQLNGTCTTDLTGALANCNFWVPPKTADGSHTVTVKVGSSTLAAAFNVPSYEPPLSTVVVTLTSLGLGFVTQMVTRTVVDLGKERRMRAEVNAFNKEKREATLAKDQVKLDKLKKRELAMRQEQAKVSTARLKVTGITFVPLLLVYYLMATFLGGYGVIVAYTPIPIPVIAAPTLVAGTYEVSLFWWYFLSSFTFSTMLSRLLHTTT
ncbi:MAG TPA: EMC3/TMCO1 family protein [Nitrososphaerales archaeon]|nr:EMC3/TMCO1 family protein [Nitrososphaerales archaeon]